MTNVQVGDWVRFYSGGVMVVGIVQYKRQEFGYWYYATDRGEIREDSVRECRRQKVKETGK